MNLWKAATTSQLLTIAYHENCAPLMKQLALQELKRRDKQTHGKINTHIKRKLS